MHLCGIPGKVARSVSCSTARRQGLPHAEKLNEPTKTPDQCRMHTATSRASQFCIRCIRSREGEPTPHAEVCMSPWGRLARRSPGSLAAVWLSARSPVSHSAANTHLRRKREATDLPSNSLSLTGSHTGAGSAPPPPPLQDWTAVLSSTSPSRRAHYLHSSDRPQRALTKSRHKRSLCVLSYGS